MSDSLELLFDLCFVVAVTQANTRLVHALAEGHPGTGHPVLPGGDPGADHRRADFGCRVPRAFDESDSTTAVAGYVMLRLALTLQRLRAAHGSSDPRERRVAQRYATAVMLCQLGWIEMLNLPEAARVYAFMVLVLAELAVPMLAERDRAITWHPHHSPER